jgi:uncharacterized cupin superfamily protein
MSDRLLAANIATADLPDRLESGTDVIAGSPTASGRTLAIVGAGSVGLWELTPGTVRDEEVDEVFVVLSGSGTVRFEDGEHICLQPGVVVRLRAGERTEWTITAPLRKLYFSPC